MGDELIKLKQKINYMLPSSSIVKKYLLIALRNCVGEKRIYI